MFFVLHVFFCFLLPTRASEHGNWMSEASPTLWAVQSRFRVMSVCIYVGLSTKNMYAKMCGSVFGWLKPTCDTYLEMRKQRD